MAEKIKEAVLACGYFIVIGALVMAGMRVAEWLIPKPEAKVLFCMAADIDNASACKTLAEMMRESKAK